MKRNSQSGQAMVFVALGLVVLLGFVGLGVDMGVMRFQRRVQQTAADAAALAEANDLGFGGVNTAAAQNGAQNNGFSGATVNFNQACPTTVTSLTVTVNNPPLAGPHQSGANSADYVEVCVATLQPTYFARILGFNDVTVNARAVATNYSGATNGNNNYNCVITLGSPNSVIEGINIVGHADLNAPTCGIADNGNFDPKGGALTVSAGTFGVSGSCTGNGPGCSAPTCTSGQSQCPEYSVPAVGNPLATLAAPAGGTQMGSVSLNGGGNVTCPGGLCTYSSISLQGNSTVNFAPGIYTIGSGGFTCHGTPGISGTGVMFYFTNGGTFNCSGNDTINLTAPSSGTYQGILFYQDSSDTASASLGGNVGSTYGGILYFPGAEPVFFGTSGTTINTGMIIADSLGMHGTPVVNIAGATGIPGGLPPTLELANATLVE